MALRKTKTFVSDRGLIPKGKPVNPWFGSLRILYPARIFAARHSSSREELDDILSMLGISIGVEDAFELQRSQEAGRSPAKRYHGAPKRVGRRVPEQ